MSDLKILTSSNFDTEVIESDRPVLVDFWAEWCGPCKALAPTLAALAEQYDGSIHIAKLNVDDHQDMRDRFGVRGIPMLALFKDGEIVSRLQGVQSRAKLAAFLDSHLGQQSILPTRVDPTMAFQGSAALKAAAISKLKGHIAAGEVTPGHYRWDGTTGSAMGCACEKEGAEQCADFLGIPEAMVRLVDILSTYHRTVSAAAAFVMDCLQSMAVGDDLSPIPLTILNEVLATEELTSAVAGDADLAALRERLVDMHRAELARGAPIYRTEWEELRRSADLLAKTQTDQRTTAAVRCLIGGCMSVYQDPAIVPQTIVAASMIAMRRTMMGLGWSDEDESVMFARLRAIAERNGGRPGDRVDPLRTLEVEEPELANRYKEVSSQRDGAIRRVAHEVCESLRAKLVALAR